MTSTIGRVQNVVITRSREGNDALAAKLRQRGFNPIPVDTISFLPPRDWSPIDASLKDLRSFGWVVFTSATGVEAFADRMRTLSLEMPWGAIPGVAAVGEGTARALTSLGISEVFTPSSYLTRRLADELPIAPEIRVLLLRADIADPVMSQVLRRRGFDVTELPIYRTELAVGVVEGRLDDTDLIVFASPSSVEGFCRKISEVKLDELKGIRVACIGPVTAETAKAHGFIRVMVPPSQTFDSLVEMIEGLNQNA